MAAQHLSCALLSAKEKRLRVPARRWMHRAVEELQAVQLIPQSREIDMANLREDAPVAQLFTKRVRVGSQRYDLAVIKHEKTGWRWLALLIKDGDVVDTTRPTLNHREEAMKEAHFMANSREHVEEEYPEDYYRDWRELLILPTGWLH
jgi:hypothetical protein